MTRQSWHSYFLDITKAAAARSTCDRAYVGAVIVSPDRQIVSTGYNGSARGEPHCTDIGHLLIDGHCVRSIHAETNALVQAGRERCIGATLYVTHFPCLHCAKLIVQSGIATVMYLHDYRIDEHSLDMLSRRTTLLQYVE